MASGPVRRPMRKFTEPCDVALFVLALLAIPLLSENGRAQSAPEGPLVPVPTNQNTSQTGTPLSPPTQGKGELVCQSSPGAALAGAPSSANPWATVHT